MAARRLLIVMLVLLGLSTLAAALIPQSGLREGETTGSTTQATTTTTTTTAQDPAGRTLTAKILVGGKKFPVVAGPVCAERKPRCEPIHVGDQLTLLVHSKQPTQLEFAEFGQFAFATRQAPARFELLLTTAGRFGIADADASPEKPLVAARIEVLTAAAARKAIAAKPKRRVRAGSGSA
jgi:hypothetical protein